MSHSAKVQRNVATMREANRLWAESKASPAALDYVMGLFDAQVRLTSAADGARHNEFTAPRSTHEGVRAYFEGLIGAWSMNYHRMEDYIAEGDRVVIVGEVSWTNRATGKPMTTRKIDIWQFNDAGKIIAFEEFYDAAALAAAATPD